MIAMMMYNVRHVKRRGRNDPSHSSLRVRTPARAAGSAPPEAPVVEAVGFKEREVAAMPMAIKTALLDFNKCHPERCPEGVCPAVALCPSKLLRQEAPFSIPMPEPFGCRACGECVRACPERAISIVSM